MSRAFVKEDAGWGDGERRLGPFVERILARAEREGDGRLAQLTTRFLR